MRIQRKGGKLLLFAEDSDALVGEHERTVDLKGASILSGPPQEPKKRYSYQRSLAGDARQSRAADDAEFRFSVQIRKNPFAFTAEDVQLGFASASLAVSWEKQLIKGVVHHVKSASRRLQTSSGRGSPEAPSSSSLSQHALHASSARAPGIDPPRPPRSSGEKRGLTAQEVAAVGKTFTFRSKNSGPSTAGGSSSSDGGVGGGRGDMEACRPAPSADDGAGVGPLMKKIGRL